MIILAIESSCDETACAIVKDGWQVLSNVISSQIGIHQATQGVVPEVAARAHVEKVQIVFDEAINQSGLSLSEVDAIAVTAGPGMLTSLMVGINFASTLAWINKKPLIAVDHIHGHILSTGLEVDPKIDIIEFPVAVLSVSGGHNDLYLVHDYNKYELLGETTDDAAGEAYDKAAKMLGLEYPGGPSISKWAMHGNPMAFELPKPVLKKGYEFSFSGLKTAFSRQIEVLGGITKLSEQQKSDLAASFQYTVNYVLSYKLLKAADEFRCKEIHLVGGVSANLDLREKALKGVSKAKFRFPKEISFCTDNAAMIARAAYFIDKSKWLKPGEVPKVLSW